MLLKICKKIPLLIYYFFRLSVLIAFLITLFQQQWLNSLAIFGILVLILLPSYFKKKFRINIPFEFELISIAFIYFAVYLGDWHGYYLRFWWWDIYLHLTSGLLLGIFGFMVLYILNDAKNVKLNLKAGFIALFAFMFAMTIGTVWEIFEFTLDNSFGLNMQRSGLVDTMWDLIMDFIGAFIVSSFGYLWLKQRIHFIIFDRTIGAFIKKQQKLSSK